MCILTCKVGGLCPHLSRDGGRDIFSVMCTFQLWFWHRCVCVCVWVWVCGWVCILHVCTYRKCNTYRWNSFMYRHSLISRWRVSWWQYWHWRQAWRIWRRGLVSVGWEVCGNGRAGGGWWDVGWWCTTSHICCAKKKTQNHLIFAYPKLFGLSNTTLQIINFLGYLNHFILYICEI